MVRINFNHPDSVFYEKYRRQLAATLTVNLIVLSHGIGLGWAAPMFLTLQSSDSPLKFKISIEETASIGACISFGGIIGNLLFGILLDIIGRKKSLLLLAVPHICSWVMVFYAKNVYFLYTARTLLGASGSGTFVVVPIFLAEIADSRVRGTMAAVFGFDLSVGLFLGNIIASHVPYLIIPCIVMVLPVLYLCLIAQFPDTPQHLLRKGQSDAAEKSLNFYNNTRRNNTDDELQFQTSFNELKKSIALSTDNKQTLSFKDIFNPKTVKALCTGIFLVFVFAFSGIYVVLNYSSMIFAKANSALDPNTNTIIIGAFQIVGSYLAFIFVDRYGRKFLLIMSTIGMCIGWTMIGLYAYLATQMPLRNFNWLPVVFMSLIILSANIGVGSLTFTVIVEILPIKIRSFGTTFCLLLMSIFITIVVKTFPVLMESLGLSIVMWIFTCTTAFGTIIFLIFLRETKGKDLNHDNA